MNQWNELWWLLAVAMLGCDTSPPAAPGEYTRREWDGGAIELDAGRIDPDGGPVGSCIPEYFELGTEDGWIDGVDLAGTSSRVAWAVEGEVYNGALAEGRMLDRVRLDIQSGSPSIAEGVVVWSEHGVARSSVLAQIDEGPVRVGSSAADEILPSVAQLEESWVAAWLELTADDTRVVARTWPRTEHTIGHEAAVERPVVTTRDGVAFVLWRTEVQLHLARLDGDDVTDATIETNHAANGAFALSMHSTGGMLAFESTDDGGATALFGIRLAADGSPRGAELRLSENGELDAGIREVGTFRGGYVVAYAGTPPGGTERMVRLVYVHGSTGDRVHTLDLAPSRRDGDADLFVASDGAVLTVWANGSDLVASRVTCGEVWLRCSPEGG